MTRIFQNGLFNRFLYSLSFIFSNENDFAFLFWDNYHMDYWDTVEKFATIL